MSSSSAKLLLLELRATEIKNTDGVLGRKTGDKPTSGTGRGLLGRIDNFFGASDPFFEVVNVDGRVVAKSRILKNTLQPTWPALRIEFEALSEEDLDQYFKIRVYDWEEYGDHHYLGAIETTVRDLQAKAAEASKKTRKLLMQRKNANPSFVLTDGSGSVTGKLFVVQAKLGLGTPDPIQEHFEDQFGMDGESAAPSTSSARGSKSSRTRSKNRDHDLSVASGSDVSSIDDSTIASVESKQQKRSSRRTKSRDRDLPMAAVSEVADYTAVPEGPPHVVSTMSPSPNAASILDSVADARRIVEAERAAKIAAAQRGARYREQLADTPSSTTPRAAVKMPEQAKPIVTRVDEDVVRKNQADEVKAIIQRAKAKRLAMEDDGRLQMEQEKAQRRAKEDAQRLLEERRAAEAVEAQQRLEKREKAAEAAAVARVEEEKETAEQNEQIKRQQDAQARAKRLIDMKRKREERMAKDVEAKKQAEETEKERLTAEAVLKQLKEEAEVQRVLAEAEAVKQAEAQKMAEEAEKEQLAIEAEAAAKEEEAKMMAEEAEKERLAAEIAAMEAEVKMLAEQERIVAEAEAAKEEEAKKLAAEAEKERLVAEAAAKEAELKMMAEGAEKERLVAEAAAAKEEEAKRLAVEAAAEKERVVAQAEAAAMEEETKKRAIEAEMERFAAEAAVAAEVLAKEVEAKRLTAEAEKERLVAEAAETARIEDEAETKRLADEAAEVKKLAEKAAAEEVELKARAEADEARRLAEDGDEAWRLAEEEEAARLEEEEEVARLAEEEEVARLEEEQEAIRLLEEELGVVDDVITPPVVTPQTSKRSKSLSPPSMGKPMRSKSLEPPFAKSKPSFGTPCSNYFGRTEESQRNAAARLSGARKKAPPKTFIYYDEAVPVSPHAPNMVGGNVYERLYRNDIAAYAVKRINKHYYE